MPQRNINAAEQGMDGHIAVRVADKSDDAEKDNKEGRLGLCLFFIVGIVAGLIFNLLSGFSARCIPEKRRSGRAFFLLGCLIGFTFQLAFILIILHYPRLRTRIVNSVLHQ